jgi:hypothetical protein
VFTDIAKDIRHKRTGSYVSIGRDIEDGLPEDAAVGAFGWHLEMGKGQILELADPSALPGCQYLPVLVVPSPDRYGKKDIHVPGAHLPAKPDRSGQSFRDLALHGDRHNPAGNAEPPESPDGLKRMFIKMRRSSKFFMNGWLGTIERNAAFGQPGGLEPSGGVRID